MSEFDWLREVIGNDHLTGSDREIADALVAVVEQAALHTFHPECELNNDPLRRALAALQAARPKGTV